MFEKEKERKKNSLDIIVWIKKEYKNQEKKRFCFFGGFFGERVS